MGHTPGPWKAEYNGYFFTIKTSHDDYVQTFINTCGTNEYLDIDKETEKANAHLIAAAPELLEAAESAMRYDKAIRSCANDPDRMASYCTAEGEWLDTLYCDWMVKSFKALKKARGE